MCDATLVRVADCLSAKWYTHGVAQLMIGKINKLVVHNRLQSGQQNSNHFAPSRHFSLLSHRDSSGFFHSLCGKKTMSPVGVGFFGMRDRVVQHWRARNVEPKSKFRSSPAVIG